MIPRLRRRLIRLFLAFTMLAYTLLLLLLMGSTILKEWDSEIAYAGHIADSIVEQLQQGIPLSEQDYLTYANKFQLWIYLSNHTSEQSGPECFPTSTADLLHEMSLHQNVLAREETVSNVLPDSSVNRITCLLQGSGSDKYYGIQVDFSFQKDKEQRLIVIYPQVSVFSIIRRSCGWYPWIWLIMLAVMYAISRFLIQKSLVPVEASMNSQKAFIAAASHELKAPLAVIQANAEALALPEGLPSDQQKQAVILEECDRMSRLIRSLLTLASSDAGSWKMDIRQTDMDTLLIETWEAWQPACRKHGATLHLHVKEACYPKVPCDKEHIGQVLGILIDNAISHTPPGTRIELDAAVVCRQFALYVIDHGPGIPDAEKDKVFERFYRGDPSRTGKAHYGLGLSIAGEILASHGGKITLTDTPGGGCTFQISLPMERK